MMRRCKIHFHTVETSAGGAFEVFDADCVVFLAHGRQVHFTVVRFSSAAILSLCLLASHIYRIGLEPDVDHYQ